MAGLCGIKDKEEMEEGQKALWAAAARTSTSHGIKMHLLSPIWWPRLDLKWLWSSRTLSCFCALQQSAPSANTQALIINPLKGLVRPQCSYYQMTRHYFWPFPCSPPQLATAAARGSSRGRKEKKKTSDLFKTGTSVGTRRGWRVSGGIGHDSMMIVAGTLMRQVYLLLHRYLHSSQDRERISLNLTAGIEESAFSSCQTRQWAPRNCSLKKRPWMESNLSFVTLKVHIFFFYLKHPFKPRPPDLQRKQHLTQPWGAMFNGTSVFKVSLNMEEQREKQLLFQWRNIFKFG